MSRFVLDSTFLIDHLRGDRQTVSRFRAMNETGDESLLTMPVVAEVWAGRTARSEPAIERFLQFIEYVHAGPSTARMAGIWRAEARANGRTLGLADALIAATAFDAGAAVLTRNVRDFELTPVRVETY